MEKRNTEEYAALRGETQHLKSCMTTYISFVMGGIGAALYFIAGTTDSGRAGAAIAAITLALVVSLVLLILLYKCNSHNRYVGYCKLLTHERLVCETEDEKALCFPDDESLVAWEICMDRLRDVDTDRRQILDVCDKAEIYVGPDADGTQFRTRLRERVAIYTESLSFLTIAKDSLDGLLCVLEVLVRGRTPSDSWRYPVFVVLVFQCLVALLMAAATYFVTRTGSPDEAVVIVLLGVVGLAWAWLGIFRKLSGLMFGADTVDAYCWRFLPVRYGFIKERATANLRYELAGVRHHADQRSKKPLNRLGRRLFGTRLRGTEILEQAG